MAEATQDAARPARKKNAHYDVFKDHARTGAEGDYELIAEDIAASSRREAIAKATAGHSEDERYGTFATVRHGEFQVLTRAKKTIVADDWGAA